jgi:glycine cleavage system H protein
MNVRGFEFPDDLLCLVEHQVWARLDDATHATVGITALGIHLAGEIYMCRPKLVGSLVEQGRSVAVVELAKSIVSVKSPVHGRIVAVNAALAERPQLVHQDPYGAGWIARIELAQLDADRAALLQGEPLAAAMAHHAWLNQID